LNLAVRFPVCKKSIGPVWEKPVEMQVGLKRFVSEIVAEYADGFIQLFLGDEGHRVVYNEEHSEFSATCPQTPVYPISLLMATARTLLAFKNKGHGMNHISAHLVLERWVVELVASGFTRKEAAKLSTDYGTDLLDCLANDKPRRLADLVPATDQAKEEP
jgi:hypothetical protein